MNFSKHLVLPLSGFVLLWGMLLMHLAPQWSANPQYHYGWLVAVLCPLLFYRRALFCPDVSLVNRPLGRGVLLLFSGCILLVWVVSQATPDWRLVSWVLAGVVIVILLAGVYLVGGRCWVAHFAFPCCFILIAVPWPIALETAVIQGLTHFVATISVELLNLLNIPALIRSNVIEVGTGILGMDDACSGVRSLQATVMLALFFGELYAFRWPARLLLPVIGVVLAVVCNILRATFLAATVAKSDVDAVAQYHDSAGYVILSICVVMLWFIARQFPSGDHGIRGNRGQEGSWHLSTAGKWLGIWLVLVIGVTEWWYRSSKPVETTRWSVVWPDQSLGFREIAIPAVARDMLRYDFGSGASWRESDGQQWTAYFFRWDAGPARIRILARMHRPEVCLPAGGYQLEQDLGEKVFSVGGKALSFRKMIFSRAGQKIFVYYMIADDDGETRAMVSSRAASLHAAWTGRRNLGQIVFEVIVASSTDPDEAVEQRLGDLLRGQPQVSSSIKGL